MRVGVLDRGQLRKVGFMELDVLRVEALAYSLVEVLADSAGPRCGHGGLVVDRGLESFDVAEERMECRNDLDDASLSIS